MQLSFNFKSLSKWCAWNSPALTGHVFELLDSGEDRGVTVLQVEDDQQGQSVVVEEGAGTTGITCRSKV